MTMRATCAVSKLTMTNVEGGEFKDRLRKAVTYNDRAFAAFFPGCHRQYIDRIGAFKVDSGKDFQTACADNQIIRRG